MRVGQKIVEVRIGIDAEAAFTEIDTICGTFDDAVRVVDGYRVKHHMQLPPLDWLAASDENGPIFYAHVAPVITFRIRQ